jgi:DNA-binding NarL/FixJ family response regulator
MRDNRLPYLDGNTLPAISTRVAIVDDHLTLVEALRVMIQAQRDMTVVAVGGTCAACLELVQRTAPRVLLIDACLPDGDGIALAPEIRERSSETNIRVLASLSDEETLLRAMQAGVCGFVSESRDLAEVLRAIRQAASGEIAIPTGLLLGLLNRTPRDRRAANRRRDTLTPLDRDILSLLARGKSVDDIAAALTITPQAARAGIHNLLQRLDMGSRLQAVTYALKYGLIEPPI